MDITKSGIRKAFKEIGYKASFKRHPLINNATKLYVENSGGVQVVGDFNVYSPSLLTDNQKAIDIANSLRGLRLLDTDEKII